MSIIRVMASSRGELPALYAVYAKRKRLCLPD